MTRLSQCARTCRLDPLGYKSECWPSSKSLLSVSGVLRFESKPYSKSQRCASFKQVPGNFRSHPESQYGHPARWAPPMLENGSSRQLEIRTSSFWWRWTSGGWLQVQTLPKSEKSMRYMYIHIFIYVCVYIIYYIISTYRSSIHYVCTSWLSFHARCPVHQEYVVHGCSCWRVTKIWHACIHDLISF